MVVAWFEAHSVAGLVLPSGWFGRPHDNAHELTWSSARADRLLLELDGQQLLILTRPVEVVSRTDELVVSCGADIVFVWREYGGGGGHVEHFNNGEVHFVNRGWDSVERAK